MNEKNDFKILLVYPNLPLMTVPPLSMAIFLGILKGEGYNVELFDTTPYISDDSSSTHKNRQLYLQYREYKDEDDLGIVVKTNLLEDFKKKVNQFKPDLMIWSVVEDAFQKTLNMTEVIKEYECVKIYGGVLRVVQSDLAQMLQLKRLSKPTKTLEGIEKTGKINISDEGVADEFTRFMKEADSKGFKDLEQKVELSNLDIKGKKGHASGGLAGMLGE